MTPDAHERIEEDGRDGNSIFALGEADVGKTYGMFARPFESAPSGTASGHAEFLIDRSGYPRGRWRGPEVDKPTFSNQSAGSPARRRALRRRASTSTATEAAWVGLRP
jgi:hypothetical protein